MHPKESGTKFSIRINLSSDWSKPNFQFKLIRIIPTSDSFGLILIENSVWINPSSDWFGLSWIENLVLDCYLGLGRIDFLPFFIKRVMKRFSDWFGMIHIGSDIHIGINRNSSDCLVMNSYPLLSPGLLIYGIPYTYFQQVISDI